VKWYVTELTLNLAGNLKITSFVKPSTGLEVKTNMANEETEKLIREDVVVVWQGSNDLGKSVLFPRY
jgi:hypothetical protein